MVSLLLYSFSFDRFALFFFFALSPFRYPTVLKRVLPVIRVSCSRLGFRICSFSEDGIPVGIVPCLFLPFRFFSYDQKLFFPSALLVSPLLGEAFVFFFTAVEFKSVSCTCLYGRAICSSALSFFLGGLLFSRCCLLESLVQLRPKEIARTGL